MEYIRLSENYNINKLIPATDSAYKHIKDLSKPWFVSMLRYNEEQYKQWKKSKTLAGMTGSLTDKLWFDFDSPNLQDSISDSIQLIDRLIKIGAQDENIQICFSGNKGISVIITLTAQLNNKQVKELCFSLAENLPTFDVKMYDNQRIFRLPLSKHEKTGLYKTPLTIEELKTSTPEQIREMAKSSVDPKEMDFEYYKPFSIPSNLIPDVQEKKVSINVTESVSDLDLSKKPKAWRNCKWSLLQGHFKEGDRHNALTVLAATCRGLGFDKDTTYYMCKSALKKQAAFSGQEEFDKNELWNNIIEQSIFSDNWEGGAYSCKTDPWLHRYCESLGSNKCKENEEENTIVNFSEMERTFSDYAINFEQNVVKTGIIKLDEHCMLLASTLNGLLGQPGAGKTSMALNYLRNTSNAGISSMFFSLDMGMPIIYAKLIQKHTGYDFNKVLDIFKNDPNKAKELSKVIEDEYKNVGFSFKSGLTVPDIHKAVLDRQEMTGQKVKLIVIDYLECIAGPYSDATANSGFIANQLKDVANDLSACILLLLQTQKHSTPDISDPLLTMKGIKGSSLIEQSCSVVLSLWREGYSPNTVENDRYISFSVIKNRFGSLWRGDFSWEGVTGNIRGMTEEEKHSLADFREEKKLAKLEQLTQGNAKWD